MRGEELAGNLGCLGCHSVDGSRRVGPSLKGVFGRPRDVTRDGRKVTVTADADYLKRAILEPSAEIVEGYPPAMPPFGQLNDAELRALIAWLESLR
jgi:cytochrome c oxidase subunit 2